MNKYRYLFVLQGNYGHGYEDLTASENRREVVADRKSYRENEGGNYRIVQRRELNTMAGLRVFYSPDTIDCYTAFPYLNSDVETERCMCLGLSADGRAVSQWGEVKPHDLNDLGFLGEEIKPADLPAETLNHILKRAA